ncbi:MAG: hypothetical protein Q8N30_10110 [Methylococcales bacterium]|jgi:hypothetical protein|nr:hypothetical protein [Methylococcales bacterium]
MNSCPFCKIDLEESTTICPSCDAKKGYMKITDYIVGKNYLVFFGLIVPFMIILFAIAAQNLFGVGVSVAMTIPILFVFGHLILGARWIK